MSISRVLAVAIAVVSLAGWVDASIVIDDYSVTQTSPGSVSLGTISSSGVPSGPVSLDRTLALGGSGGSPTLMRAISDDVLTFSMSNGMFNSLAATRTMTVTYTLGGPLNLLGSEGNSAFYFSDFGVGSSNASAFSLVLGLNGSPTNTSTVNLLSATSGTLVIPFSSFANPSVLSSVTSLSLTISASLNSSFGFAGVGWSSFVAAPEPSSMLMAGFGLVGLIGAARRRRSA